MKQSLFEEKRIFRDILLVIIVFTGFLFIVAFSVYYVSDAIDSGRVCGCAIPVPLMILLLSSLGVFVGSLMYYIITSRFIKQEKVKNKENFKTLRFLDKEERNIVKLIINNNGGIKQSELVKNSGIDKVKVSRVIKRLVEKQIIVKKEEGKINHLELHEDLKKVFFD